jgi:hypothetical protein
VKISWPSRLFYISKVVVRRLFPTLRNGESSRRCGLAATAGFSERRAVVAITDVCGAE